jgi:thiol-disulfide isomerase/thioredoxin
MRSPQATDAVEAAFQDSASTVREAALEALPNMDRERGLRLELAAFDDDDLWIRESIASKVSADLHHTLFDRRSIPTLVRALDDSSPVVQTLSMSVLRRLTGKSWRVSSKAPDAERSAVILQWKQWWQAAEMTYHLPHEFDSIAARHSTRSDPAPDFHLTDTAGNPADLSSERGKIVLLNFWGTWCPPCKKETPDLIRLDADCRSKGVDIIGVALSEKGGLDLFRKTCAERGILFRQAMATDAILSSRT